MSARPTLPLDSSTPRKLRVPSAGAKVRHAGFAAEALETRISPATLDLSNSILTLQLDPGGNSASMSESGGVLTFDVGTKTFSAVPEEWTAAGNTASGSMDGITDIVVLGTTSTGEKFTIANLSQAIPGLGIDSSIETIAITSPTLHTTGTLAIGAKLALATSYTLQSDRDITIAGPLSSASGTDLVLDALGGIAVTTSGSVEAGRDLTITAAGKLLDWDDQGIRIEADGANAQIKALRDIVISTGTSGNPIALGGFVTTTNSGSTLGNIRFTGPVDVISDAASVYAAKTGSITFEGAITSAGHYALALESAFGNVNFQSQVGTADKYLKALTIGNAFDVSAADAIATGCLHVESDLGTVKLLGAVSIVASEDSASSTTIFIHADALNTVGMNAADGAVRLEVDALAITGLVQGSAGLTIVPITLSETIGLGADGDLSLSASEMGFLKTSSVTVGASNATGAITIGASEISAALTVQTAAGIHINGKLASDNSDAALVLSAKTITFDVSWGDGSQPAIATEGAAVTLSGAITLAEDTLIRTSTDSDDEWSGGDVTITATINGAHGFKVDAYNGVTGGEVTFNGLPKPPGDASIGGGTKLTSLTVDANLISLTPQTLVAGSQTYNAATSITTHTGALSTSGTGDIKFNGPVIATSALKLNSAGDVIFTRTVDNLSANAAGALSITAAHQVTFQDEVGATPLKSVTINKAALVTVQKNLSAAGAVQITASEIDFMENCKVKAASVTLQPLDRAQAIRVGESADNATAALEITQRDLAAVADDVGQLVIGRTDGSNTLSIEEAVTFLNPVVLRVAGRSSTAKIQVKQTLTADESGSITLAGAVTELFANIESAGTGSLSLNALSLKDHVTISSAAGSISFNGAVLSASERVSANAPNLTVISEDGAAVTFSGNIGNGKDSYRVGDVLVSTSGLTTVRGVDALSFKSDSDGTTILRGNITTRASGGIDMADAVKVEGNSTLKALGGDVVLEKGVTTGARAYSISLVSDVGDVRLEGGAGTEMAPLSALTATSSIKDETTVTIAGAVYAGKVTVKGCSIAAADLIRTTLAQSYTAVESISLGRLDGDTTLSVSSAHDISNAGAWTFDGRATLKSSAADPSEGITVSGNANSFGSVVLSGRFATVQVLGNLNVAGGSVSGVDAGLTTLTAEGSVIQTGGFQTQILEATAQNGSVIFDLGSLSVKQLGAIHAHGDIKIVRGGRGNLELTGVITSDAGDILIAADLSGTGKINNSVGAGVFELAAGHRYLLFSSATSR